MLSRKVKGCIAALVGVAMVFRGLTVEEEGASSSESGPVK
jgi:hypothetical protein